MNPFIAPPEERLATWISVRKNLPTLPEKDQLDKVAHFWGLCPLNKFSLDVDAPETWVTVWEMIYSGDMCRNAVAVAMESTLRLSGWDPSRLSVVMVFDRAEAANYFVVKIDDEYLLNYSYGTTALLAESSDLEFKEEYRWSGRAYKNVKQQ